MSVSLPVCLRLSLILTSGGEKYNHLRHRVSQSGRQGTQPLPQTRGLTATMIYHWVSVVVCVVKTDKGGAVDVRVLWSYGVGDSSEEAHTFGKVR